MNNIILVGKAGSGKDTVAAMFTGYNRISFAFRLKQLIAISHNFNLKCGIHFIVANTGIYDSHMNSLLEYAIDNYDKVTKRHLMQVVGQGFRDIDPDFWINWAKQDIFQIRNDNNIDKFIVTDCRYENELNAFKDYTSIYIHCPNDLRMERLKKRDGHSLSLNHVSELGVSSLQSKCDYFLDTGCNMDTLKARVLKLMENIEKKT